MSNYHHIAEEEEVIIQCFHVLFFFHFILIVFENIVYISSSLFYFFLLKRPLQFLHTPSRFSKKLADVFLIRSEFGQKDDFRVIFVDIFAYYMPFCLSVAKCPQLLFNHLTKANNALPHN